MTVDGIYFLLQLVAVGLLSYCDRDWKCREAIEKSELSIYFTVLISVRLLMNTLGHLI